MNHPRLVRANDQKKRLKSLGLLQINSPTKKALADPKSLRKAINAFCFECMQMRREGRAVLFVHHYGKNGLQRTRRAAK